MNTRDNMTAVQQGRMWNFTVVKYSQSGQIDVTPGCFAFMFTNIGDVIARVNDMVIFPSATPATALGDSRSLSGHVLDFFKGNIALAFEVPTAGITPNVEIVQLFYVEKTEYKTT
jgi:hypothetical protein